ncbi:OmpA family protein [Chitinophaga alhagiae]|uniref:OmpA family protein n=1 Tax=Chitinophaga alhagiae TaxID=2203219 RepID=UPI000E5A9778|nr:OmpA family protein [Chitinophaga alhagiae]
MAFDLLDTLKNLFNNEFSRNAATSLGESEGNVQKALGGIIPAVLTGLLNKASSPGEAGNLLGLVKEAASGDFSRLGNLAGSLPAGMLAKGADLLRSLFGNKAGDITSAIAAYAGIKPQSAETLLQTAAPASLGVVGQQVDSGPGLLSFLNSQKDKILAAVPSGLGLAGLLGVGNLGDIGNKLTGLISGIGGGVKHTANTVGHAVERTGGNRWLWMLIAILAIILLIWYLLRGCGQQHTMVTTDSTSMSGMHDSAVANVSEPAAAAPIRESIKVTLPDGTVLDAFKGGIEDRLVAFLQDPNTKGGKDQWFDFDNLNFKTGSAELTPESQAQVNNIVAILNAFPKAKIKIGGYTDAVGDPKKNKQLSQERAESVVDALQAAHVKPVQILGAEGYGAEFAKAPAEAPDEERKADRRISVSVREK